VLRVRLLMIAISMLFGTSAALAAEPMAPNDIKATALWHEIQNDFYAGRKGDSRTTRTVRQRECWHMETKCERFLHCLEARKAYLLHCCS
jgi:hypothetical protein